MIYHLFATLMDMSITASVVILVVLFVRCLLSKAPKKYAYILWAIVGIRLLCPVGITSPLSIYNFVELTPYKTVEQTAQNATTKEISKGQINTNKTAIKNRKADSDLNSREKRNPGDNKADGQGKSFAANGRSETTASDVNTVDSHESETVSAYNRFVQTGAYVWLGVCLLLILWNVILFVLTKQKVRMAVRLRDNIYECDNIPTPFVMGIVSPKIYIPYRLNKLEQEYIIGHEKYHIKRKDNVFQLLACLLCCVFWFNPFVWLSYFLMIRDMEMSCDEYVLQAASEDIRGAYSKSLLGFAVNSRGLGVGMLAFGESDTRKRVKHVMKFKTAKKWIGAVAIIVFIFAGTCCLTDASEKKDVVSNGDDKQTVSNDDKKTIMAEGESTKKALSDMGKSEKQYVILSTAQTGSFETGLVFLSDDKTIDKNPESGYFVSDYSDGQKEGNRFLLMSSRDGRLYDTMPLSVNSYRIEEISFPADGITLHIADYDGNGEKNDFSLGQGQLQIVAAGNFMKYAFFGVDARGNIVNYLTSTDNRHTIVTIPGDYSGEFLRKDGQLEYTGLTENGTEKSYTTISHKINLADAKEQELSPEYSLYTSVCNVMPSDVLNELEKKGVWTVIYDDSDDSVTYSLGNDAENPTLRLDFSFDSNGNLVQYVSKDYGFVSELKQEEGDFDSIFSVIDFGKEFLGISMAKGKMLREKIEESSVAETECYSVTYEFEDGKNEAGRVAVWQEDNLGRWDDDTKYVCYRDSDDNIYVCERNQGMVVYVESSQRIAGNQKDTSVATGADGARIYYADEKNIIFGGGFGIYQYSVENEGIDISYLNLDKIGCNYTQGDHYCEVSVSKDGHYVYLHPIDSDSMYRLNMKFAEKMEKMSADKLPAQKNLYQGSDTYTATYTGSDRKVHKVTLINQFDTVGDIGYVLDGDISSEMKFFIPSVD